MYAACVMLGLGFMLAIGVYSFLAPIKNEKRSSHMLVLSRSKGEVIELHVEGMEEPIRIVVTDIRGERARIGVKAPFDQVKIYRAEIVERMQSFQEIPNGTPETVA